MQHLESSGTPVLYIGRMVLKGETCCTLSVILFKMPFISQCYFFWFLYYSHFTYKVC